MPAQNTSTLQSRRKHGHRLSFRIASRTRLFQDKPAGQTGVRPVLQVLWSSKRYPRNSLEIQAFSKAIPWISIWNHSASARKYSISTFHFFFLFSNLIIIYRYILSEILRVHLNPQFCLPALADQQPDFRTLQKAEEHQWWGARLNKVTGVLATAAAATRISLPAETIHNQLGTRRCRLSAKNRTPRWSGTDFPRQFPGKFWKPLHFTQS